MQTKNGQKLTAIAFKTQGTKEWHIIISTYMVKHENILQTAEIKQNLNIK